VRGRAVLDRLRAVGEKTTSSAVNSEPSWNHALAELELPGRSSTARHDRQARLQALVLVLVDQQAEDVLAEARVRREEVEVRVDRGHVGRESDRDRLRLRRRRGEGCEDG
jgi:hypothetical protein